MTSVFPDLNSKQIVKVVEQLGFVQRTPSESLLDKVEAVTLFTGEQATIKELQSQFMAENH